MTDRPPVPRYLVLETDLSNKPHLTLGGIPNILVVKAEDYATLDAERQRVEEELREYKAEPIDLKEVRRETLSECTKEEMYNWCILFMRKRDEALAKLAVSEASCAAVVAQLARLEQLVDNVLDFVGTTPGNDEARQECALGRQYLEEYLVEPSLVEQSNPGEGFLAKLAQAEQRVAELEQERDAFRSAANAP